MLNRKPTYDARGAIAHRDSEGRKDTYSSEVVGPRVKAHVDSFRADLNLEPRIWKQVGVDRWVIDHHAEYERDVIEWAEFKDAWRMETKRPRRSVG